MSELALFWPHLIGLQVVAYDFGIKHNILRRLASFGCQIIVVPADYPAEKVMQLNPDGVFFSNGPVSWPIQHSSSGQEWPVVVDPGSAVIV